MRKYMDLLGLKARDRVTGLVGVVECVCFDLYGCVQVTLRPAAKEGDNKAPESQWFDHKRLEVVDQTPVMDVPSFDEPGDENGPAQKPNR